MASFVLSVTTVVICVLIHAVLAFRRGQDKVKTDTYGTHFIFPRPVCGFASYFKLQLLSRGFDPVAVKVTYSNPNKYASEGASGRDIFYGELRDGNSSTLFLPCNVYQIQTRIPHGAVTVESSAEIMLHLLLRNDSYAVLPTNSLSTHYTLLSIPMIEFDTFIIIITPTATCNFSIKDPLRRTLKKGTLADKEIYTYVGETSLTGMTVISSKPVFVVSGMYPSREPEALMLEQARPEYTTGRNYFLAVPFSGQGFEIHLAAYAARTNIRLQLTAEGIQVPLEPNGTVVDLSAMLDDGTSMVTVRSSTLPFQLLFLLQSPEYYDQTYKQRSHIGKRLCGLVSTAPVEQYLSDPCRYSQINTRFTKTIVAGRNLFADEASRYAPLHSTHNVPLGGPLEGLFWVRASENTTILPLGMALNGIPKDASRHRMWFHEQAAMQRSFSFYYLEAASFLTVLDSRCTSNETSIRVTYTPNTDDRVDNDCDGVIDEEIVNGLDDDGDGQRDEDTATQTLRNCHSLWGAYFWETNRYRNTRFEPVYYEFAQVLPKRSTELVVASAGVGIIMVFIFIFCVWILDMIEQIRDPGGRPHIF